ncbi:hypothetical protein NT01EI_1616 [Edwardsiella ictaluri 93-146]|uniref:Uncharacterized protein n=1 Tax=Edwardsiella ictaluri (strain 93-146) TaxID=634503 RepID=C5B9V0_EDWI9|nr:hypothetical protein NT01EI_1616 [Edwardsiella ictaluri 93-146]
MHFIFIRIITLPFTYRAQSDGEICPPLAAPTLFFDPPFCAGFPCRR